MRWVCDLPGVDAPEEVLLSVAGVTERQPYTFPGER